MLACILVTLTIPSTMQQIVSKADVPGSSCNPNSDMFNKALEAGSKGVGDPESRMAPPFSC